MEPGSGRKRGSSASQQDCRRTSARPGTSSQRRSQSTSGSNKRAKVLSSENAKVPRRGRSRAAQAGPSSAFENEVDQALSLTTSGATGTATDNVGAAAPHDSHGESGRSRSRSRRSEAAFDMAGNRGSTGQEQGAEADAMRSQREDAGGFAALQSLLARLGTTMDDVSALSLMAGGGSNYRARYKAIVDRLEAASDDAALLSALMELAEFLSMSHDDQLTSFPLSTVAPILTRCLQDYDNNPNIMVYAARVVTWLADILPFSCSVLVRHDVVPALCARLLVIEYIDVAEQCLSALGKLSKHVPEACLEKGGMTAMLSYLSFFPVVVQRSSVATAARMAAQIRGPTLATSLAAVPLTLPLLDFEDGAIVLSACEILQRIASAAAKQPGSEDLERLAELGLLERGLALLQLTDAGRLKAGVPTAACFSTMSTLATCAAASADLARQLLEGRLHHVVHQLLSRSSAVALGGSGAAPVVATDGQLRDTLGLLASLLPRPPAPVEVVQDADRHHGVVAVLDSWAAGDAAPRVACLCAASAIQAQLASLFLPQLHNIISVHSSADVRSSAVRSMIALLYLATPRQLADVLREVPISSFVKVLLTCRGGDVDDLASGTVIACLLLDKLPAVFAPAYVKEGTHDALKQLADLAPEAAPAPRKIRTRSVTRASGARPSATGSPASPLPPPPPPPPATAAAGPSCLAQCATLAHGLLLDHFRAPGSLETDGLAQLRSLTARLAERDPLPVLQELFALLAAPAAVSTFELQASGVVPALTAFITARDTLGQQDGALRLQRLRDVACALRTGAPGGEGDEKAAPLHGVVQKLVSTLESQGRFEVVTFDVPMVLESAQTSRYYRSAPANFESLSQHGKMLWALQQPLRLQLKRAPGSSLGELSVSVAMVDSMSRIGNISDFLQSRVIPAERSSGGLARRAAPAYGGGSEAAAERPSLPVPARSAQDAAARVTRGRARAAAAAAVPTAAPQADARGGEQHAGPHDADGDVDMEEEALDDEMDDEDALHDMGAFDVSARGVDDEDEDVEEGDEEGVHPDEDDDEDVDDGGEHDEDGLDERQPVVQDVDLDSPPARHSEGAPAREGGPPTGSPRPSGALHPGSAWASGSLRVSEAAPSRRVVVLYGGAAVPSSEYVLRAIARGGGDPVGAWARTHAFTFGLASEVCPSPQEQGGSPGSGAASPAARDAGRPSTASREAQLLATVDAAAAPLAPCGLPPIVHDTLILLRLLEQLVLLAPQLALLPGPAPLALSRGAAASDDASDAFTSTRTNARVLHQVHEALALICERLPPWLDVVVKQCKCLLPFDTRRQYLYLTSFDIGRTLINLSHVLHETAPNLRQLKPIRQKVRISRSRVRDSAIKVFSMPQTARNVLEFEFYNEVGTGLGPTLEVYTLLAQELSQRSLQLWRDASGVPPDAKGASGSKKGARGKRTSKRGGADSDAVYTRSGLFPKPYMPGQTPAAVLTLFDVMGKVVAKCLQDQRLLDLDLSAAFLSALMRKPLGISHLEAVDPTLAASLLKIRSAASAPNGLVDGTRLEDLCLNFTLPGYRDYELCPGGTDIGVDATNVEAYCDAVVHATLEGGVRPQIDAFLAGFDTIFDSSNLQCLYEAELELLLRGQQEAWSRELVLSAIQCDHGYSKASKPVHDFVEVLCSFSAEEQRAFLRFVTGAPRLPPGGLAALQPRLTVVQKKRNDDVSAQNGASDLYDHELPSVMTCQNYIKLPPYSSSAACKRQFKLACTEGQGSFHMS